MRIFDAVSSGAAGLYCKNFISTGQDDPCVKKNLAAGQITEAGKELKENLHWFDSGKPEIATAVFFPGSSNDFYNKAARLRENLDFDLVDERMAKDGALKNYKHCYALEEILADKIKDVPGEKTEGVYATKFQDKIMYYNSNNYKVKKGLVEIGANSIGSSPL